jgi:hypothetical protein
MNISFSSLLALLGLSNESWTVIAIILVVMCVIGLILWFISAHRRAVEEDSYIDAREQRLVYACGSSGCGSDGHSCDAKIEEAVERAFSKNIQNIQVHYHGIDDMDGFYDGYVEPTTGQQDATSDEASDNNKKK